MKRATFFFKSSIMGNSSLTCEGEDWYEVVDQLNREQDLACLCHQGCCMAPPEDEESLAGLEEFLDKYYQGELTREDIANLNVELSIGGFKCISVEDDEEPVEPSDK